MCNISAEETQGNKILKGHLSIMDTPDDCVVLHYSFSIATSGQQLHFFQKMSSLSFVPCASTPLNSPHLSSNSPRRRRIFSLAQPSGVKSKKALSDEKASESENVLLKVAWYSSELLGIAASVFRSPKTAADESPAPAVTGPPSEVPFVLDRETVITSIKDDFSRSYFVTGNLTLAAYREDCEFADPAGSFRGLQRFKRNCSNFGSLIERCNMKLTKWEDFEDKGIGHWRFSCVMSFPWKPILSATGFTEYYFDKETGKVCRHVEHWNVPKMALLRQLLRPTRPFLFWR